MHPSVTLRFTKEQCDVMITKSMPIAVCSTFMILAVHLALHLRAVFVHSNFRNNSFQSRQKLLLRGIVSTICIGVASVPFLFLTPELSRVGFLGSKVLIPLWFKI